MSTSHQHIVSLVYIATKTTNTNTHSYMIETPTRKCSACQVTASYGTGNELWNPTTLAGCCFCICDSMGFCTPLSMMFSCNFYLARTRITQTLPTCMLSITVHNTMQAILRCHANPCYQPQCVYTTNIYTTNGALNRLPTPPMGTSNPMSTRMLVTLRRLLR